MQEMKEFYSAVDMQMAGCLQCFITIINLLSGCLLMNNCPTGYYPQQISCSYKVNITADKSVPGQVVVVSLKIFLSPCRSNHTSTHACSWQLRFGFTDTS